MTTFNENPAASTDIGDTSLITKLMKEVYSEFTSHGTPSTPAPVSAVPTQHAFGSTPTVEPNVAPVHTPVEPPAEKETTSGGHNPGAQDSYAFGEPRCVGKQKQQQDRSEYSALPTSDLSSPDFYFLKRHSSASHGLPAFDVAGVRKDFPALHQKVNGKNLIWLDNAATTHKPQAVIDATSQFYSRDNSNIHRAAHTLAARSTELYEGGREKIRKFIGAKDAKEIVFVRGTTEAINLVAQTFGRKNIGAGDEILLTTMEHHANIVPWQILSEQTGAVIRVAPINDSGELMLDQFATLLGPRTKLVAITHVANALGTVNPVEQIIAMAHAYGVPVLVDGAQSSPHMPINVQAMDCDFFALSGHKIFGPTGIGILYGKAEILEAMPPWQGGGNMIQDVTFSKTVYQGIPQKFEAGTQDIAGVVGLGSAVDYLMGIGMPAISAYEHDLLVYATDALKTIPGLRLIGTAPHKASVLSFVLDGLAPEKVGKQLDSYGIAVRSGHHCAQPALRRYGLNSTVRPSLAFYNTYSEIDSLVQALYQIRKG